MGIGQCMNCVLEKREEGEGGGRGGGREGRGEEGGREGWRREEEGKEW